MSVGFRTKAGIAWVLCLDVEVYLEVMEERALFAPPPKQARLG